MKEFDSICKEFEQLDAVSYAAVLTDTSARVIPALTTLAEDGLDGLTLFASFVMGAVVADGSLSPEEYALCYPLFRVFFGEETNYKDCNALVKSMRADNRQLKRYVDDMVDLLGLLSDDLKEDIILVCLILCAVDGKISAKEKRWIKQLIR